MIFRFNKVQLSRSQRESLTEVVGVLQLNNEIEIEVWPLEFPEKFSIKAGDDVTVVAWDYRSSEYKILPSPEPEPESSSWTGPSLSQEPEPEPEPAPEKHTEVDPIKLAILKYELMSTHLNLPLEKKIIFNKEYARLWSEHK